MPAMNLHLAAALLAALIVAYALILRRMVRGESRLALAGLGVVLCASVALRLIWMYDYPPGLNEDEVLALIQPWGGLHTSDWRHLAANPLYAIQGTLWRWLPAWWAIRLHPLVCGVLASVAGYAAARTLGARIAPALVAALALACLPWAVIYGRSSFGGDVVWHYLIGIWAASRCLAGRARWPDALVLGLATGLLLLDYQVGRVMPWIVLAAVPIAPNWRQRAVLLGGLAVGLALYAPTAYVSLSAQRVWWGMGTGGLYPMSGWYGTAVATFSSLWIVAADAGTSLSVPTLSPQPWGYVALGLLAVVVVPDRRVRVWLLLALCISFAPPIVTRASTHRMICAWSLLPIMCALTLSELPFGSWLAVPIAVTLGLSTPRAFADATWAQWYGTWCHSACSRAAGDPVRGSWPPAWRVNGRVVEIDALKR